MRRIPSIAKRYRRQGIPLRSKSGSGAPTAMSLGELSENYLDGTSASYLEALERQWQADASSVPASFGAYFRAVYGGAAEGSEQAPALWAYGHQFARVDPLRQAPLVKKPWPEAQAAYDGSSEESRRLYCGSTGYELAHLPQSERDWLRARIERQATSPDEATRRVRLRQMLQAQLLEEFLAVKFNAKRFGLDGCEVLVPALTEFIDVLAVNHGLTLAVMGMAHRGRLAVLCNLFEKPFHRLFHEFDYSLPQFDDVKLGSGDVKYHLGASCDHTPHQGSSPVHVTLLPNPSHLEAVDPVVLGKTYAAQRMDGSGDAAYRKAVPILVHGDASVEGQGVVYESADFTNLKHYYTGGVLHVVVNNQIGFTTDPVSIKRAHGHASPYCTEGLKATGAPVLHVNADDADAVLAAMRLAAEYRAQFAKDVVVDLVCIRRLGHNELDQPMFTQPLMYQAIAKHPISTDVYAAKLKAEGLVTEAELAQWREEILQRFNEDFESSKRPEAVPAKRDWLAPQSAWVGMQDPEVESVPRETSISRTVYEQLSHELVAPPPNDFELHRAIKKVLEKRSESLQSGKGLDWATAEALAFGSLMKEGHWVRLSGQDVQRGTFSHRHAVVHCQKTGRTHSPLQGIQPSSSSSSSSSSNSKPLNSSVLFEATNSNLSEYGVLGFELGVSYHSPAVLPVWEAQFGDFANGAQIVFDQFVSSQEQKWHRMSALVCLLPHGYDGQGPEHSSARLERFLQLSDSDPHVMPLDASCLIQQSNFQLMNLTTPANYFHALRRQLHRNFRKPLIVMSPKRLLKHPLAVSSMEEMVGSGETSALQRTFLPVRAEPSSGNDERVKRLLLCSGNVYYDLLEARKAKNRESDVAIATVEQLAPFPFPQVADVLRRYPNADVLWVQEEPKNQGAWSFMRTAVTTTLRHVRGSQAPEISYAGRPTSAATATGSARSHKAQLDAFLNQALD